MDLHSRQPTGSSPKSSDEDHSSDEERSAGRRRRFCIERKQEIETPPSKPHVTHGRTLAQREYAYDNRPKKPRLSNHNARHAGSDYATNHSHNMHHHHHQNIPSHQYIQNNTNHRVQAHAATYSQANHDTHQSAYINHQNLTTIPNIHPYTDHQIMHPHEINPTKSTRPIRYHQTGYDSMRLPTNPHAYAHMTPQSYTMQPQRRQIISVPIKPASPIESKRPVDTAIRPKPIESAPKPKGPVIYINPKFVIKLLRKSIDLAPTSVTTDETSHDLKSQSTEQHCAPSTCKSSDAQSNRCSISKESLQAASTMAVIRIVTECIENDIKRDEKANKVLISRLLSELVKQKLKVDLN